MRQYLKTIHQRSPSHKKRFALVASGVITLAIFAIWSAVKFGGTPIVAKATTGPVNLAATVQASPFENIWSGITGSWHSLTNLNGK